MKVATTTAMPTELLECIAAGELQSRCWSSAWAAGAAGELLPLQAGDVPDTKADVAELIEAVGYRSKVPVEEGVANCAQWCREHYGVQQ